MSYAIIRNAKYKRENLMAVYRHNERKNKKVQINFMPKKYWKYIIEMSDEVWKK